MTRLLRINVYHVVILKLCADTYGLLPFTNYAAGTTLSISPYYGESIVILQSSVQERHPWMMNIGNDGINNPPGGFEGVIRKM